MKKTRFTETQIVKALKEHEGGRSVEDICREMDISKGTLYTLAQSGSANFWGRFPHLTLASKMGGPQLEIFSNPPQVTSGRPYIIPWLII